jgi:RNA recognition motif-containing protein
VGEGRGEIILSSKLRRATRSAVPRNLSFIQKFKMFARALLRTNKFTSFNALNAVSAVSMRMFSDHVIKIRGLPFRATEGEIREVFKGVQIGNFHVSPIALLIFGIEKLVIEADASGRSSGFAYMAVSSPDDFDKAMTYDRAYIGTRYIELEPSDSTTLGRVTPLGAGGFGGQQQRGPQRGGGGRYGEEYSLNPNNGPPYALMLKGIPFAAGSGDVKRFFDGIELSQVVFEADASGRKSGNAFVVIENFEDAERAFARNREYMGTRFVLLSQVPLKTLDNISKYEEW